MNFLLSRFAKALITPPNFPSHCIPTKFHCSLYAPARVTEAKALLASVKGFFDTFNFDSGITNKPARSGLYFQ